MTDREFENYLALLGGMLRLRRTQRDDIAGELRDHLIEHVAHLEASGHSHEEAVRRALEEFGDAAALAANFSALVGMRRRRLIMRCTIGTTVVMTGLVVAMLAFRPEVVDDPSIAQAQAVGSNKSAKSAARQPGERLTGTDIATRQRLEKQNMDAEFIDVPLADAFNYISDQIGVQFYVDKQSLSESAIAPDAPVTLQLKNVPAEMVLDLILRQLELDYRLRNGVIMVAGRGDIQAETEVRVYRVPEGMAEELAALIPATVEIQNWSEHTVHVDTRGRRRAGYGSTYSAAGGGSRGYGGVGAGEGEIVEAESIGGGGAGTIRVFRGVLVISQTPEIHQKIEKLIEDIGRTGAMDPKRRPDGAGMGMMPMPGGGRDSSDAYGGGYGGASEGAGYGSAGGGAVQPGYGATAAPGGYGATGRGGYGSAGGGRARGSTGRSGYGRGGWRDTAPIVERDTAPADDSVPSSAPAGGSGPGQPPPGGRLTPAPDSSGSGIGPGRPPVPSTQPQSSSAGRLAPPESGTSSSAEADLFAAPVDPNATSGSAGTAGPTDAPRGDGGGAR